MEESTVTGPRLVGQGAAEASARGVDLATLAEAVAGSLARGAPRDDLVVMRIEPDCPMIDRVRESAAARGLPRGRPLVGVASLAWISELLDRDPTIGKIFRSFLASPPVPSGGSSVQMPVLVWNRQGAWCGWLDLVDSTPAQDPGTLS